MGMGMGMHRGRRPVVVQRILIINLSTTGVTATTTTIWVRGRHRRDTRWNTTRFIRPDRSLGVVVLDTDGMNRSMMVRITGMIRIWRKQIYHPAWRGKWQRSRVWLDAV